MEKIAVLRRAVSLVAVVALAAALTSISTTAPASAESAPHGPNFPPPGGVDWSSSGSAGRAGGQTWSYENLDLESFRDIWWGPNPVGVKLSTDGSAPSPLSFDGANSDLAGGLVVWSGTSTLFRFSTGDQSVPTRLELRTSTWGGDPIPFITAESVDIDPTAGAVIPVTDDYRANFTFLIFSRGSWKPVLDEFDALDTNPACNQCVRSSFGAGFYWSNRPPVCDSTSIVTDRDTAGAVEILCVDPDGDAIESLELTTPPLHGTVARTGNTFTYTPDPLFHGTDSFGVSAADFELTSAEAIVGVTVNYVDYPPTATGGSVTTDRNVAVPIGLQAADVDDQPLTYTITGQPSLGTLSGTAPNLVYTPAPNSYGSDVFTFTVSDGTHVSNEATVSVSVNYVDYAPVATDDAAATPQYTAVVVDVLGNDYEIDGQAIAPTAVSTPGAGSATINPDGTITYVPSASFKGGDSFDYTITDANGATATATVTISEIGCGESGPVSAPVDTVVEPLVGSIDVSLASTVHGVNCDVIAGAGL